MCGIVGATAHRDIVPVLLEGLRRLEYRGYDSCGVALMRDGAIGLMRTVSRVSDLAAKIQDSAAMTGIAHTRWATHGAPATENAHPIVSRGEIAVVHNGIIENHDELRAALQARGYRFESQTDTEVISHLVHSLYEGDLLEAVRRGAARLKGAYAIAVVARQQPGAVVGARAGSPLVVASARASISSPRMRSRSPARPIALPTSRKATSSRSIGTDGAWWTAAAGRSTAKFAR
jgi:glucosamine--fructose-6-phosphate aminotransferase (isomerizing)